MGCRAPPPQFHWLHCSLGGVGEPRNPALGCLVSVQCGNRWKGSEWLCPQFTGASNVLVQTDGINQKEHEIVKKNARVLQMYNNLQKRYNKEVKINQGQSETIATLSAKINELEHQLRLAKQKVMALESKIPAKNKTVQLKRKVSSHKCMCKKKGSCSCKYLDQLLVEIQRLKMENETISKERRMLRNEIAALDKDFFDEIEDLKYALQEAIKMNTRYERCLKQLSSTYGVTLTSTLPAAKHRGSL
nr:centrosomal protein of 290 kDa-like isoform X2 [Pogona vitticeps]